jgi:hypothetical protein
MAAACATISSVAAVKTTPKRDVFVTRQADFFQEQRERDACVMLQAVLTNKPEVNATKAKGKMRRKLCDIVCGEICDASV